MNTRVPEDPRGMRKKPGQRRSQATVAVILQAAARVLAASGWAKFTTNEVARVAGVSVGSLYQYFPNKLALAEAIRQQHLQAILQVFTQAMAGGGQTETACPLRMRVETLIDGIIAVHRVDPRLHRVLLDEVPLSPREAWPDFEQHYAAFYAGLATQAGGSPLPASDIAGRVLASAVEGVVHDAARRGELDAAGLRQALYRLVLNYLAG